MPRNSSIPAAYIIMRRGTQILLSRRLNTGYMDGLYQFPAGHVEPGELPIETAYRELTEEVGVHAEPGALSFAHAAYRIKHDATADRLDVFFHLSAWQGTISNPEPEKCGGWEWHDLDHLPADLIPFLRTILELVAKGVPYSEHRG